MIIGSFGATRPVFGNLLGNLDSPNCPDVQLIQMLLKSWPIPSIFIRCLFSNVISSIINEIIIKVVDRRSKRPNLSSFLFRCVWGQLGLSELPQKYFFANQVISQCLNMILKGFYASNKDKKRV